MQKIYRCDCGKAYKLEVGKKYKCKNCDAIMAVSAEASEESTPKAPVKKSAPTRSARPGARREGRPGASREGRPGARRAGAGAGARSGKSRSGSGSRARRGAPAKQEGMSTGAKAGIGIGAVAVVAGIIYMVGGSEVTQGFSEGPDIKYVSEDDKLAAKIEAQEAAAKKEREELIPEPKAPPKKLSKEEYAKYESDLEAARGDIAKLHALFDKARIENWQIKRKPLYLAMLRIDPYDKKVTAAKEEERPGKGTFERDKLNFDIMQEKYRAAVERKDKTALYDTLVWVFENNLYKTFHSGPFEGPGLDWHLIYKQIYKLFPDDHETRIYKREIAYDGTIQEYRGKKLPADDFQDMKEKEWELYKEGVGKFPFPLSSKGGG